MSATILDIASDGPAICNIGENATVTVADKIYVGENNEFAPFEGHLTISGNATVEVAGDFASSTTQASRDTCKSAATRRST